MAVETHDDDDDDDDPVLGILTGTVRGYVYGHATLHPRSNMDRGSFLGVTFDPVRDHHT